MGKRLTPMVALVGVVWLAACSTPVKSPVIERSTVLAKGPQSASTTASSSAPAIPEFHRVAPGETLATIARRYGVSREALIQLNGLSNPDRIFVGQNLRLRPASAEEGSASGVQVFPVGSGTEPPGEAPPPVAAGGRLSAPPAGGGPASGSEAVAPPPAATATAPGGAATGTGAPALSAGSEGSGAALTAGWVWPAKGPVLATFDGKNRKGVDIGGQEGDAVVAAADGTVSYVGEGIEGFGLIVILQHPGDFVSVYAHNQKVTVKEGETVRRGQTIAHLGRTGNTDRPKLHFQIRRAGKAIDPETLLPKR